MMCRIWRIRLTWTLAILYGFVAALGEGLHLLPGQGHCACCCCAAEGCNGDCPSDCHDDCHGDCCHDGDFHASRDAWLSGSHDGELLAGEGRQLHDEHACAICHFLAQCTWFSRPAAIQPWRFLRGYQPPAKPIFVVSGGRHLLFLSRAPPAPLDS
jgi:hypothetical protein